VSRRLVVEADGGSRGNPGPAGYGAVVRDADTGEVLRECGGAIGVATNNVAEYRGLIAGLRAATELDPEAVEVRMDSKLVVQQMSGAWQVKHPDMQVLAREAAGLVRVLPAVRFVHVPRMQNSYADRLANEAMDSGEPDWSRGPEPQPPNRLSGWMAPTAPPTVLWVLRHGQTPLSPQKRFSGSGDTELTDAGRAQAAAAARRIKGLDVEVVVSSPLRRALQTATAAAEVLGVDVTTEDGLRETDFGEWEGSTFSEVRERWPDQLNSWLADPKAAPPGGESFGATQKRVSAARKRIAAAHPGRSVLVVTHVTPIKLLVAEALQAPLSSLFRTHVDLASLSRIDCHADGPMVLRLFNDISHL